MFFLLEWAVAKIVKNDFFAQHANIIYGISVPVLVINLIVTIVLRCRINSERMAALDKCEKDCNKLIVGHFKNYYRLIADLSNEYYKKYETTFF